MDANNKTTFSSRIQLSESEMRVYASVEGNESTFSKMLEKSLIFVKAGLTPVYIYDPSKGTIELTSDEKMRKLYH